MIPDFQSTLVFRFIKLCSALKSWQCEVLPEIKQERDILKYKFSKVLHGEQQYCQMVHFVLLLLNEEKFP